MNGRDSNPQPYLLLILKALWVGGRIKLIDIKMAVAAIVVWEINKVGRLKMVAAATSVRGILIGITADHGSYRECPYTCPPGGLHSRSCHS